MNDKDENCRKTWLEYQREGLFTDVLVCCMDGETQIHRIMLFEWIPCLTDLNTDSIILPQVTLHSLDEALSKLYKEGDGLLLSNLIWGPGKFIQQPIKIKLKVDQTQIKSEVSNSYEEVDQSNAEIDLSHVDIVPDIVEEIKEEGEIFIKKQDDFQLEIEYQPLFQPKPEKRTMKKDNKLACDLCGNSFTSKRNLKKHWNIEHAGPPSFKCDTCDKSFSFKNSLDRHHRTQHLMKVKTKKSSMEKESERIQCQHCDKSFGLLQNLARHERVAHHSYSTAASVTQLRCDACNLNFSRSDNLKRHMLKYHFGDKPGLKHKCHLCDQQFRSKIRLYEHQREMHESYVAEAGIKTYPELKKEYDCQKCDLAFKKKSALKDHMAQLHNIGSYYCEICDISLKTKDSYKYHKTKHNPKFSCEVCGKQIETQAKLIDHLNVHTGNRPYKCETLGCGKSFTGKGQLYQHMKKCLSIIIQTETV